MVGSSAHFQLPQRLSSWQSRSQGFVLVEMLLVIAIVSILATIILIAINPAARLAESANGQRQSDLALIRNALENYATANNGRYPSTNGEYWCQDCTYVNYEAKGVNNWIPFLVADGFIKRLPQDTRTNQGSACNPVPNNSYAGYVYYSPSPPNNTAYKLFAFCTPPNSVLNTGKHYSITPYCTEPTSYDSTHFNPRPAGQPELRPFVDPVRPDYAYAIYTPGLACL
jgi:prepilin-type N-terminal cleavage/methylation domain-containing protein